VSTQAQPSPFQAAITRRMRRAGLSGRSMRVELAQERVALRGERGGTMTIAASQVERMRVGFVESEDGISYQTLLWCQGEPEPVPIAPMLPLRDPWPYAAFVRQIASRVARGRGMQAIEVGASPLSWLALIVLMTILLICAIFVALILLPGEPGHDWWGSAVVIAVPAAIVALLVWNYRRVHRPRSIDDLSALDRYLPRTG
jgi:hypothetical protein